MPVSLTAQPDPSVQATDLSARIAAVYRAQQDFFRTGATRSYAFRKQQLKKLMHAIEKNEQKISEALYKDLRKSAFEAYGTEIGPVLAELDYALRHLRRWMQPVREGTPLMFFPSSSTIQRDPLGMVLTIGPWNYPFLLIMSSVVGAMAGGNTVILKPSDLSVYTSRAIEEMFDEHFPEEYVAVIQGPGELVGRELVGSYHFDHIFFTGSVSVGRKIMEMAARHLSPVTLELGGKSPCIVDQTANLDFAARKIAWSKLINAGQTCVAPDYLLVHASVRDQFIEKLKAAFTRMLGNEPRQSPDYGRLLNEKRFQVVSSYLDQGRIIYGGQTDASDLFIGPTLLSEVNPESPVMTEEIFGPVLPVISFNTHEEVLTWIERNPYPLSLYVYTGSQATERFYTENVRFGGGCINNGVIHLGNPDIPFGGVGTSGIGQYHGRYGYDTFTRPKSIMRSPTWFDAPLWYPPYKNNLRWIRKLFRL
jgi:aldehyde dehydrogenase (NAD+)